MVFKKFLASMGIGGATVDTVLAQSILVPGEMMRGTIRLQGGNVDQTIDRITLVLESVAERENSDYVTHETIRISQHTLLERFTVPAGKMLEVPFEKLVPIDTPLTRGMGFDFGIPMTLRTEVEIAGAINPSDRDPIAIEPNRAQALVLQAMQRLNLQFAKADVEFGRLEGARFPFFQEIEFRAHGFSRSINEVELTFVPREHDMDVILEIDRKSTGWARLAYSSIDQVRGFNLRYSDIDKMPLEKIIEQQLLR